jgi:hypothetical protein
MDLKRIEDVANQTVKAVETCFLDPKIFRLDVAASLSKATSACFVNASA